MTRREVEEAAARSRATYDAGVSELLGRVWGGNLHMGLFQDPAEPLLPAQLRAKRHMAEAARLQRGETVVEAACGVGSTARYLAKSYGVRVCATNIPHAQIAEPPHLTQSPRLSA